MNTKNKFATALFFISLVLPLILFYSSVDDFSPRHMASITEISFKGHLSEYDEDFVPGYYAYGGIISLVSGISGKDLLFMPVQLIPFAVSFFLFISCLSRDYLFASVFTIVELITGITGSPKIYFWPHGIGWILFFITFCIFLKAFNNKNSNLSERIFLLIVTGSSLAFISYDFFAMELLFIGLSCILFFLVSDKTNPNFKNHFFYSKKLFGISLILLSVELGLSNFFYNTFFEIFFHTNYIEISGIDKLIISFFYDVNQTHSLDNIIFRYPRFLTLLYAAKYFILVISMLFILTHLIHKLTKHIKINLYDIFILAVILMTFFYSIIRLHIGQNIVTYLYLPGIICSARLYQISAKFRNWAVFVILSLFLISAFSYYIMDRSDLLNKDDEKYSYLEAPSYWYIDHGNLNVSSDELSRGFFLLYASMRNSQLNNKIETISMDELTKKSKVITTKDAKFLLNESSQPAVRQNYMINYNLKSMNLQNWVIIKSWESSREPIEFNNNLNKIYTIKCISIYYS